MVTETAPLCGVAPLAADSKRHNSSMRSAIIAGVAGSASTQPTEDAFFKAQPHSSSTSGVGSCASRNASSTLGGRRVPTDWCGCRRWSLPALGARARVDDVTAAACGDANESAEIVATSVVEMAGFASSLAVAATAYGASACS